MATEDLLTLEEAKDYLKISLSDESEDDLLAAYVTATSRALARADAAGTIVKETLTAETIPTRARGGARKSKVRTLKWPVASWTSIMEYDDGDATELSVLDVTAAFPDDSVLAFPYQARAGLFSGWLQRYSGTLWSCFEGDLVVTYVSGRFDATASVPEDFKHAARLTLKNLWRDQEPSADSTGPYETPSLSFPTYMIPNAARMILGDEWHGGSKGAN